MQYARPSELAAALDLLDSGRWDIMAGGTDYYPSLGEKTPTSDLLDITAIKDLRGVTEKVDHWRIGALTTWSDIVRLALPAPFKALQLAAREVGSVQIQNRATIGGNLCNASPAADGVPALMILDAEIELTSADAKRQMPLAQFISGNRETALQKDELLTAVLMPRTSTTGVSSFIKLGSRRYLVISTVMTAARLLKGPDGEIIDAAISVGACSVVARRIPLLEKLLIGRPCDENLASLVRADQLQHLTPIDDVRAPAAYRRWAAEESIRRALAVCVESAT